ncbi:MAG: rod shape-determining protein [Mycoplasmataceae bacterium]|nr:rod shape-determining protein [Mycoplasmataceae bacterium]
MAKDKRINNLKNIVDQQPTFIAVDLGTANTIVYVSTHGIIFNEPTILAYATKTGEILYVGKKAYKMIGKTHENKFKFTGTDQKNLWRN